MLASLAARSTNSWSETDRILMTRLKIKGSLNDQYLPIKTLKQSIFEQLQLVMHQLAPLFKSYFFYSFKGQKPANQFTFWL